MEQLPTDNFFRKKPSEEEGEVKGLSESPFEEHIELSEGEPVEFNEIPSSQITAQQLEELTAMYRRIYGELWQGDEDFLYRRMPSTSSLMLCKEGGKIVGATNLDGDRAMVTGVDIDYPRRAGLMLEMIKRLTSSHPSLWMTVSTTAKTFLKVMTSPELGFGVVEDKDEAEALFEAINRSGEKVVLYEQRVTIPILGQRLRNKGRSHDKEFIVFTRDSSHGAGYLQVLMQNIP